MERKGETEGERERVNREKRERESGNRHDHTGWRAFETPARPGSFFSFAADRQVTP